VAVKLAFQPKGRIEFEIKMRRWNLGLSGTKRDIGRIKQ
jgi:hypothetical protein